MHPTTASAGNELYLVLRKVSTQLAMLLADLQPLSAASETAMLAGVDALYQRESDLGLLCLRFDEALVSAGEQALLIALATEAGISVLDPQRLEPADRKLFYDRYLRRYAIHIDDHRSPDSALSSLGQLLGLVSARASSEREITVSDDDSYLLDPDADENALTRVDDGSERRAQGMQRIELPPLAAARPAPALARSAPPPTPPPALGMDFGPAGRAPSQARGKAKRSERLATIPARPNNSRATSPIFSRTTNPPPSPPPKAAARVTAPLRARMSSPPPFALAHDAPSPELRVRFQRGDSWMPGRLRNLTTKEVRLAASAAPGLGQKLDVSITLGEHATRVHGTVVEVVTTERSVDGSTTFRLEFDKLDAGERDKLVLLLRTAQREGVSLSPPPPRRNTRFAISWPVAVVSEGLRFNAAALDISERGLFLATSTLVRTKRLAFGISLDREKARIQGRARIARQVSGEMAARLDLQAGYGLQIEDLSNADKSLFNHFLVRVRKRSQKHILVVGEADRSQLLAECFQAAGYAVSKAHTIDSMLQRTDIETGGLNMAVIDQRSLSPEDRAQFVQSLQERHVPILRLEGHTPGLARNALDQALHV